MGSGTEIERRFQGKQQSSVVHIVLAINTCKMYLTVGAFILGIHLP